MARVQISRLALVLLFAAVLGAASRAADARPEAARWTAVDPGGETVCAHGGPYRFYVHEGASDHLLVYFQGGGACWDGVTCSGGPEVYDRQVDQTDDPTSYPGLFDLQNPENPFTDYDIVSVSYCSADVYTGDTVRSYDTSRGPIEIQHRGVVNTQAVLDWTFEHYPTPDRVFVMGCSAGGIGAMFHAPAILRQYDGLPRAQLSDSSGGFRGDFAAELETWGTLEHLPPWLPGLEGLTPAETSFARLYGVIAAYFPEIPFAEYNTAHDAAQRRFLALTHNSTQLADLLAANLSEIQAAAPNFRYYLAGGAQHCITPTEDFYRYSVDGVRFVDWVRALANGDPVDNVQCTDCAAAP